MLHADTSGIGVPRTSANALLKISKTLESASGKATVLLPGVIGIYYKMSAVLPVLCVLNGNVYVFTYLYRYIATSIHHVYTVV